MANAFSVSTVNNEYISPVNTGLINTVLASKEQKYSASVAKVDAMLETYAKTELVRDKDKQLLYDNINNVLNTVNGVSKMNLSKTDTTRQIEQAFQGALTPYLGQQLANSAKIKGFMSNMAKLKEKSPEKYNDLNMEFALKQAGYDKYMDESSGIDSLGKLEYSEYQDINKLVREPLEKWAKEFGYDISNELTNFQDGSSFLVEAKRKRLTPERIREFLTNQISSDPKLVRQMQINSWGEFKGLTDEQFTSEYRNMAKENSSQYAKSLTKISEERDKYLEGTPERIEYDRQYALASQAKERYDKIADSSEPVNRQSVEFSLYGEKFLKGFEKTYSYDRVEDFKLNDAPLKIAAELRASNKELREQEKHSWERNEKMGLNADGSMAGVVTEFDLQAESDINQSLYQISAESYEKGFEDVRRQLSQVDDNFAAKTKAQQDIIIKQTIDDSSDVIKIDGKNGSTYSIPDSIKDTVNSLRGHSQRISAVTSDAVRFMNSDITEIYSNFLNSYRSGSDLKIDNMASNAPAFVEAIKKGKSFDNLTSKEKLEVGYEIAKSINSDLATDARDKERVNIALKSIENDLKKVGGYSRQVTTGVERRPTDYSYGALNVLSSLPTNIVGGVRDVFRASASSLGALYQLATEGEEAYRRSRRQMEEELSTPSEGARQFSRGLEQMSGIFKEDEDFNSLGVRDVSFGGINIQQWYKTRSNSRNDATQGKYDKYTPTLQKGFSVTFNPEKSSDKPYAEDIKSIIQAHTKETVSKNTPVSMKIQDGKYVLEATTQKKELVDSSKMTYKDVYNDRVVTLRPDQVTERLRGQLSTRGADYSQSIHNPNRKPSVARIAQPISAGNKTEVLNSMYESFNKSYSPETSLQAKRTLESFLKTPAERMTEITSLVKNQRQKDELNELYNADFNVTFLGSSEEGFRPVVSYRNRAGELNEKSYPSIPTINSSLDKTLISAKTVDAFIKEIQNQILIRTER